jgi:hypothetical protein
MFYIEPRVSGYPMISNFGYPVPELPDFAHPYCAIGLGPKTGYPKPDRRARVPGSIFRFRTFVSLFLKPTLSINKSKERHFSRCSCNISFFLCFFITYVFLLLMFFLLFGFLMFYIEPRVSGYPMISNLWYPVPELPDFAHP